MNEDSMIEGEPSVMFGAGRPQLVGRMGVIELVLTVLAFAAPLASVVGVIPLVIALAGESAPLAFMAATAVLLAFSVGFTAMGRHLSNPGAFYAYVSVGINRTMGLAASFLAVLGYLMIGLGIVLFFGLIVQDLVVSSFHGPAVPWWVFSLGLVLGVGTFGYFRIDLSARVLAGVMAAETMIVVVFDIIVGVDGGPTGVLLSPFDPGNVKMSAVGISVLFATITFIGFEATAIFREETRNPDLTVPRATYVGVVSIGVFYILTSWMIVTAYGVSAASDAAATDPAGMFVNAVGDYIGRGVQELIAVLVVTSAFAAVLSCQNIIARYGYSLGVDGVIPRVMGRVHPRHGSPYVSSLSLSAVLVAGVLGFSATDPAKSYAWLAGAGGLPLLVLMFTTSVAIVLFFRRSPAPDLPMWKTLVAPLLAAAGLGAAIYLALRNFVMLTGGDGVIAIILQVVIWSVFASAISLALYYRSARPEVYARIGRQSLE